MPDLESVLRGMLEGPKKVRGHMLNQEQMDFVDKSSQVLDAPLEALKNVIRAFFKEFKEYQSVLSKHLHGIAGVTQQSIFDDKLDFIFDPDKKEISLYESRLSEDDPDSITIDISREVLEKLRLINCEIQILKHATKIIALQCGTVAGETMDKYREELLKAAGLKDEEVDAIYLGMKDNKIHFIRKEAQVAK